MAWVLDSIIMDQIQFELKTRFVLLTYAMFVKILQVQIESSELA